MKKVLIVLAVLGLALVVLLAVVVATTDVDRFRPLVSERLSQALGRPVTLERLSWKWQDGVAVQTRGVAVHEGSAQTEPLIRIESAYAVVKLGPLLQRRIEVSSVGLDRPQLRLIRDAQGQWNLTGLAVAGAPASAARPPAAQGGVAFKVGSVRLQDGIVRIIDQSTRPPATVELRAVNVTLRHIAPGEPMDIDAGASLGATNSTLRLRGQLTLPGPLILRL